MAITGTPYRIMYQAPRNTTGLTDVVAYVITPELAVEGPFAMMEMPGNFEGTYFYDYDTLDTSLAGEYFVRCYSATIGQYSDVLRISFSNPGGSDIQSLLRLLAQIIPFTINAKVSDQDIKASVYGDPVLFARLESDAIYVTVRD